jgi:hypothetical protein
LLLAKTIKAAAQDGHVRSFHVPLQKSVPGPHYRISDVSSLWLILVSIVALFLDRIIHAGGTPL